MLLQECKKFVYLRHMFISYFIIRFGFDERSGGKGIQIVGKTSEPTSCNFNRRLTCRIGHVYVLTEY